MFDCIIIGAGVIGVSVARALSRYNVNVLVLEKNGDVGSGQSGANSAIIHSGYDPHVGTLKAKYNVLGNKMWARACEELDVEFKQIGSITVATKDEQLKLLEELAENGRQNGVPVRILDQKELFEIEPFVTKKAIKGLLAPTAGIVNPFEYVVHAMENAMDNGVKLHLEEEVLSITSPDNETYLVKTNKGEYETKVVINAAGLYSDEINNMFFHDGEKIEPRRGQYYVLDHFDTPYVTHTLFSLPSELGKGVLVSPTTHGNYLIGPSSDFIDDKEDTKTTHDILNKVVEQAKLLVDDLHLQENIREFSGLRAYHKSNDFVINMKKLGFINLLGIQSPGFVSSLAIAEDVIKMVDEVINLEEKENYNPIRRKQIKMAKLSLEERDKVIKENPDYGQIICRCEGVSLGEIKDAIHRNCGATSIKGVKKRVRPGFGKCQGSFCETLVNKILANELHKDMLDIKYQDEDAYILTSKLKGGAK